MVHGLVETTQAQLFRDLLLLELDHNDELTIESRRQLPSIKWEELVDNPAEIRRGWSMFKDQRNAFSVDGRT